MAASLFQIRNRLGYSLFKASRSSLNANIERYASSAAVKYEKRGQPTECLKLESLDVDLSNLGPKDVAVEMLAAPINPSDLNMVEGTYDILPQLPAIGGNEGVAKVTAVGASVTDLAPGDWVIPANPGFGTWRLAAKASEEDLMKVPNSIPAEYAACLSVNPCTAYRMLNDFVDLQEGDVIIQNGANSMVGQSVIQMAKAMGVTTVNVVRQRPQGQEVMQLLKDIGGDIVVFEDYVNSWQFERLMADLPKPSLALNCVGGKSATNLARSLAPHGTLVTYGGMSKAPVALPSSALMYNDITAKGFWMSRWNKDASKEDRSKMINNVAKMFEEEKLDVWVERHPFKDFNHALKKAVEPFYFRKVVLCMQDS
mmetsp:Transcript_29361/g.38625  ORF Transcript_29361/g.38625 Transcript_29361/m.38625 type:complete len:369 (-) Transcript_29361:145-1251(-)|eukprot:CAMPEP_0117751712 /NCGR_PEP_ID=MMETSP0947-20121206/11143_1 /TAXON_ID=44440 /ORGANISM="Chattonella subsalsa, Strain CCMP2191" /LENGTH=368 /DNA_ID=CAMNT_0005570155 /DNA_START=80 /DNA_END=1186 /DNA_ORIENTATION=+